MNGTSVIITHYFADPAALGQVFATGALADSPEGYVVVEFLEEVAGQEELHDLVDLVAAYKEVMVFGNRRQMHDLGRVIDSEIRTQRARFAKIQLQLGQPSPNKPSFYSSRDNWMQAVRQTLVPLPQVHVEGGEVRYLGENPKKTNKKTIHAAESGTGQQWLSFDDLTPAIIERIFAVNGDTLQQAFAIWRGRRPTYSELKLSEAELRNHFLIFFGFHVRFYSNGRIDETSIRTKLDSIEAVIEDIRSEEAVRSLKIEGKRLRQSPAVWQRLLGEYFQEITGIEQRIDALERFLLVRDVLLTLLGRPIP